MSSKALAANCPPPHHGPVGRALTGVSREPVLQVSLLVESPPDHFDVVIRVRRVSVVDVNAAAVIVVEIVHGSEGARDGSEHRDGQSAGDNEQMRGRAARAGWLPPAAPGAVASLTLF